MALRITQAHRINFGLLVLLAMMGWCTLQLIGELKTHQRLSQDLAELRDVKYGMLNANVWVRQVTDIVQKEIQTLEVDKQNRARLKKALERILDTVITEVDRQIQRQHRSGDWWDRTTGQIKESVRNTVMDVETVKAGIPQYAEKIMQELERPETRAEISAFMASMVSDITRSTFAEIDEGRREAILERYGCDEVNACKEQIKDAIEVKNSQSTELALITLLCAALLLVFGGMTAGSENRFVLVILSAGTLLLLLGGVLTPMMEVEAQITEMKFMLLGHPVQFYNEVFYYQSKSVLDVVSILIANREIDMIIVGFLIMTFSVVFPAFKLLSSLVYIYAARWRRNPVIDFFALKSSKWSMADVMVIAIFMAYIGFSGMIDSQMDLIAQGATSTGVDVLTTQGTSLQIGFFMFLAFCIASLIISSLIQARVPSCQESS